MKLGIIVGRAADTVHKKFLKGVPEYLRNDDSEVPADVACAWYIKKYHPDIELDIITPSDITLKRLNKNDFVYVMYDLIDAYNEGGISLFMERKSIYSRTKAILYPDIKTQKLIISKSKYYKLLKSNGVPIAPFLSLSKVSYLNANLKRRRGIVKMLLTKIENLGWPGVILKPELGSYGTGIKLVPDINKLSEKKLGAFLDKAFLKKEFQAIVVQRFMEDFPKYYEVRTYWINGSYRYSIGTIIDYTTLGTGNEEIYIDRPKSEGGEIPDDIIEKMKEMGDRIVKIIPNMYNSKNLLLRLDFGCCQVKDDRIVGVQPDICKKYFLNEIELTPNLFVDENPFPMIETLGDALVEKALKLTKK